MAAKAVCELEKTGLQPSSSRSARSWSAPSGRENGKRRRWRFQPEILLVMTNAARQKARADDAVADDHDGGEDRIARQRRLRFAEPEHDDAISPTSMTVTAMASTSGPTRSPSPPAMTSA